MAESFVPHSHIPYGSSGSGFYSDNTIGCFKVVEAATPRVLEAINAIPFKARPGRAFTICDYGTADGGISMFLMKECIQHIQKVHGDVEINILYEDQPVNDFQSLFLRINGMLPGPPSYLESHQKVYVAAVGTGFYDQCCASGTVDLAFSATAMHWLRERPCSLTGALHHTVATNEEEKSKFAAQAAQDWETILLHRARELSSGGQMVVASLGIAEDGQNMGNTKGIKTVVFAQMTKIWQQLMVEKKITQEEFQETTFINYHRTVAEYKAPLEDPNSPVYKAGLRLVSIETKRVPCPYHQKWMKEGKKGDKDAMRAHARWYVPTLRTWSNSTFTSGLSESRSQAERESLVDELFRRYEDAVAECPEDHALDYIHAYITMRKETM